MNRATCRPRQYPRRVLEEAVRRDVISGERPDAEGWGKALRYGGALLLAVYLLFAHGCHGEDEDHELSAPPVKFSGEPQATAQGEGSPAAPR